MKKFFTPAICAIAAIFFAGCTDSELDETIRKEESSGKFRLEVSATAPRDTRTAFGDRAAATSSYPVVWVSGDEIAVVEYADGAYSQQVAAAASSISEEGGSAVFTAELNTAKGSSFDYYACYPASAYSREGGSGFISMPDTQTPRKNSVDPDAMLLEARAAEGLGEQASSLNFSFSHVAAYARMTVGKIDDEDAKIEQILFISDDLGLSKHAIDGGASDKDEASKILTLDVSSLECTTSGEFDVWFALLPAELNSFMVVVKTADANYTKSFTSSSSGRTLSLKSGALAVFKVDMTGAVVDRMDYEYLTTEPSNWPRNDEKRVYERPFESFNKYTMPIGALHPNKELAAKGWKLYTLNEFSDGKSNVRSDGTTTLLPYGLYPHNTAVMNESAIVRNEECGRVENGRLIMEAHRLPAAVSTGFKSNYSIDGMVEYEHAAFRTYPSRNKNMGDWFSMAPNMRFEVRCRRTNTQGFNNAVWFQGNILGSSWPTYGEIDVVENPKPNANNQTLYQTLHFGPNNDSPGWQGPMADLTRWNIFWLEIYPDKIVMGANDKDLFSRDRNGANTLETWPWDQADGFYLILSTGMYDKNHSTRNSWAGSVRPADFNDPNNLPTMEFDWIRVYVNDDYDREKAMGVYY